MCGLCSQIAITTTQITTTTVTNLLCSSYECLNGGMFSLQQCKCQCYPTYTGRSCESLMCNLQPSECTKIFLPSQCTDVSIANYCPVVCGKCQITTTNPTTSSCNFILPCMNGGTFQSASCLCSCHPNFSGF
jgi:hypothetical protein